MTVFRRLVSQDKVRFETDEFDLDLSYITQNIIAMGFPSTGFSSNYRNPLSKVVEYFDTNHPQHYKVINLSEEIYHETAFNGPVEHFPFPDHTAPPFPLLLRILKSIHDWLHKDPLNVVAIHCLAGMGRTGTIISCTLLIEGLYEKSEHALDHFAQIRTNSDHGVQYPSQQRWAKYVENHIRYCKAHELDIFTIPPPIERIINRVILSNLTNSDSIKIAILICDAQWDPIFNSAWIMPPVECKKDSSAVFETNISVKNDFHIKVLKISSSFGKLNTKEIMRTSLNTAFFVGEGQIIPKQLIDGPHKDLNNTTFPPDLSIVLEFSS